MTSRYGLQIRAPAADDTTGLAELLLSAAHTIEPTILARRLEACARSPGIILIAQEWGPPSGIISLQWHPTVLADAPVARITMLLVAQDARRRGVGRLLLKAASQAARVAGCDALECFPDEGQLLEAFLLATGFTRTGWCFSRPLRKKS